MRAGDRLPVLERHIALSDMVAYGAATWDWHRIHYDVEHARRAGLAAAVVDGQFLGALLAEQILRTLRHGDRLARLYYRNRAPVYPDSTVLCEAVVTRIEGELIEIEQTIRVGDAVVVAPAGAEVIRRP